MSIKSLKLATGEELVVEITDESADSVTFKNPLMCALQRGEKGPLLGFMPWMQSSDGPFVVNRSHVVLMAEVAQDVKNGYNQIFGAGIVVPPQQLITG